MSSAPLPDTPGDNLVGCLAWRPLDDGREIAVIRQMYNYAITIGPRGAHFYDDKY